MTSFVQIVFFAQNGPASHSSAYMYAVTILPPAHQNTRQTSCLEVPNDLHASADEWAAVLAPAPSAGAPNCPEMHPKRLEAPCATTRPDLDKLGRYGPLHETESTLNPLNAGIVSDI